MHKKKWNVSLLIWILFLIGSVFYEPIFYLIQLGRGQAFILLNTQPIEDVLQSEEGDSIKEQLLLIKEIYTFGTKELGLSDKGTYQNYYNQHNKPVLWVLTVCEPYGLNPVSWSFPIAGTVSYKGFFDKRSGLIERNRWRSKGYDVALEEVYAWSTLGWFKDPVMSEMLHKHPGDIANTLLHEMTHATVYKKGDIEFNENIASFVGDKGAEAFLIFKYGEQSEWLKTYQKSIARRKSYSELVLNQAIALDQLYASFANKTDMEKKELKGAFMQKALLALNTFRNIPMEARELNNCYYADVNRYRKKQIAYDDLFKNSFSGKLDLFINSFKKE